MPRSGSIQRAAARRVVVCDGPRLSAEERGRLVSLLASGLERYLERAQSGSGLLNHDAGGAMYVRHPDDEVTRG